MSLVVILTDVVLSAPICRKPLKAIFAIWLTLVPLSAWASTAIKSTAMLLFTVIFSHLFIEFVCDVPDPGPFRVSLLSLCRKFVAPYLSKFSSPFGQHVQWWVFPCVNF